MASVLARIPGRPFSLDPLIAEAKRRARRRRWLGLLAVVAVGGAVLATFELRPASGSGLATVGGRPVTHIVIQDLPGTIVFNLRTGKRTVKTLGEEMWLDRRANWHHVIATEGGRQVADQVWRSHYGPTTEAAAVDAFYAALGTDYRAALRSGRVKLVGRGTFDGHRIDWLAVTPRRDQRWYVLRELGDVGIDARTFKPVLLRGPGDHYFYTRILEASAIAYHASDFKAHGPTQRPRPVSPLRLASGFAFGSASRSAPHSTVVRVPWLTAGTTVAGLKLRAVTPFTIRRSKHHFSYGAPSPKPIHGLELVYQPASEPVSTFPPRINLYGPQWEPGATTAATTIYEVPQAPRVPPWTLVPAGSIEIRTGLTTLGKRVVHTLAIGYLREHGLYVTVRTPQGLHTALQIARSLHAAQK